jgi:3D (Asp-Asp-Asp) domain-containing protein
MKKHWMTLLFSFLLPLIFATTPASAAYVDTHSFLLGQADTGVLYGPPIPHSPAAAKETEETKASKEKEKVPVTRSGDALTGNLLKMIPETLTYQVKKGDSLYNIALSFGTDIETLQHLNGLSDANFLNIGQELKIPNALHQEITTGYKVKNVMTADLTAYTAGRESTGKGPGDPGYGVTASGAHVRDGHTIAVDTSIIPMGSKVYIEGIGIRTAEDTGGAIRGNRIDVYMSDLTTAIDFGYKRGVKIYLLEDASQKTA